MTAATYAILLFGALAGGFVSGLAGFGTALMALGIGSMCCRRRWPCRWC